VRKADNLTPSCAVVMKSGNLNFLEPSGPLRAYNGDCFTLLILQKNAFGKYVRKILTNSLIGMEVTLTRTNYSFVDLRCIFDMSVTW